MMTAPNMRYLEASLNSAAPEELTLKLYDALILFCRQAILAMENTPTDIEARHRLLLKAQRACAILMGGLRLDLDSDIPKNLLRIYEFWHHELVTANMQAHVQKIKDILPLVMDIRETWVEVIRRHRAEKATTQAEIDRQTHQMATAAP
jgi:flagellar secretion chaperone FliS